MPQELHVLSCYKCHMFQVDIVKKITRWTCKMCGEKQSLIKVYAKGSGRECREIAQNLNKNRITSNEKLGYVESDSECETSDNRPEVAGGGHVNKWSEFLSTENKSSDIEDDLDMNSNNGRHVSKISTFNSRIKRSDSDGSPVGVCRGSRNKWSEFLNEENNKYDYNNINNDDYNYDVPCKKRKICKDSVEIVENTDYKGNVLTQRRDHDNGNKWNVFLDQKPCQVYEKENRNVFPGINNTNLKVSSGKSSTIPNIFADNEEDIDTMLDI